MNLSIAQIFFIAEYPHDLHRAGISIIHVIIQIELHLHYVRKTRAGEGRKSKPPTSITGTSTFVFLFYEGHIVLETLFLLLLYTGFIMKALTINGFWYNNCI